MSWTLLLLLSSVALIGAQQNSLDKGPEMVQVLFRNGEALPGNEQTLTELGKYRIKQLGRKLSLRYSSLLAVKCKTTYARTLDRECNKASLRTLLTEMCPDHRIPMRMVPWNFDYLLNFRICPKYKDALDAIRSTYEVQKMLQRYDGLYSYIKQETDMKFDNSKADEELYDLYNLMDTKQSLDYSLPKWCTNGVLQLLREITFLHYNIVSNSTEQRKINGGQFLRRFLKNSRRGMYIYSGTGHNVAGLARALGRISPKVPDHGTAIILEKWNSDNGTRFVKILLWSGVSEKVFVIKLKHCPTMCPLNTFKKIFANVLPDDKNINCLLDQ